MTATVKEIYARTRALSFQEKTELLDCLLVDVRKEVPKEVEDAQIAEVERRRKEFLEGKVKMIPGDEVLAKARARFP
jgi:hypothetical protein